jgi:hypothetical protein
MNARDTRGHVSLQFKALPAIAAERDVAGRGGAGSDTSTTAAAARQEGGAGREAAHAA